MTFSLTGRAVKLAAFISLLAIAALTVPACGSSGSDSSGSSAGKTEAEGSAKEGSGKPITIGFAIGETGVMAPLDVPQREMAELAADAINAEGGIEGRQLKFVSANIKSEPELSGNGAVKVMEEGAEVVIVSGNFDIGAPAAIAASEKGVLSISPGGASPSFGPSGSGPLSFSMASPGGAFGAVMAEWAHEQKGIKSAYSLTDNTLEFMKETAYGFKHRWEEIGGDFLGESTFKQEDQSIASQINEIKSLPEEPEAIFISSYMPGQASAIKQMRAAGLNMPILAEEDIDGSSWKAAIPNLSDVYYSAEASIFGDDPDPKINKLIAQYEEKSGKKAEYATLLTGYAAIEAVAAAVEKTGGSTEGAELQAQFETFKEEPFILETSFDESSHITLNRSLRVMQIQGGKTTFVEEVKPKKTPIGT